MTFEEAKNLKIKKGETFIDKNTNIEYELVVFPKKEHDQDKFWVFINENFNDFDDDDAIGFSTNNQFTLWAIGEDEHTGQLLFDKFPM